MPAARFPKAARLLKTDEFSSVFNLRPYRRSPHFVLYMRPRPLPAPVGNDGQPVLPARLGVVVGRKHAPNAVTRNLVKRATREAFRLRGDALAGWDIVLRLQRRFSRDDFVSASSPALKRLCRDELAQLFDAAAARAKTGASPQTGRQPGATQRD